MSNQLTIKEQVQAISKIHGEITDWPWTVVTNDEGWVSVQAPEAVICNIGDLEELDSVDLANAEFIANAPDDINCLLHIIDTLDTGDTTPAIQDVIHNVNENWSKRPNMRTLMEEVAEAILADRGKHDHPLRLELVQIAGICINMIRQIDAGEPFKQ
jgi:hypothetical protein